MNRNDSPVGNDSVLSRELARTEQLCHEFLSGMVFLALNTGRDPTYSQTHLLTFLADEYLETTTAIVQLTRNGIHNVCRRELRFLLEMSVKMSLIQHSAGSSSIEEKLVEYRKLLNSSGVSFQSLALYLLPEAIRPDFLEHAGRLYGRASKFVHLTVEQFEQRMALAERGFGPASYPGEELAILNQTIEEVLAASFVIIAHAVPTYAVGDWFTGPGLSSRWLFGRKRYVAYLDEHFDYKFERQAELIGIREQRWQRVVD